MLALDGAVETPFEGVFSHQGPLGWLARNGTKPGRGGETWVCQASPNWSREWLGGEVPEVQGLLEDAWREIIGPHERAVIARQCHRWLYARVAEPLGEPCLWDADLGIGACGDWCQGARVEAAWLSGIALAGRVLGTLSTSAASVR
jgi:predicted NAD/FAD-dependent oxidoreductase